ncbi:HIT-like domain-containing protein [Aspergillus venezuelensis]
MPPSCPFCKIAAAHPADPPTKYLPATESSQHPESAKTSSPAPTTAPSPGEEGHAFLILSTHHVLAFLDIMPLTQGHVLVVPRQHHEKLGEVGVRISRELGTWLPILSRAIMRTVFGESTAEPDPNSDSDRDSTLTDESWHWNIVQNNGAGAAQVVPHVHFHIVPRPPLGAASTGANMSFIMFGRGSREDLDDEEAEKFVAAIREGVAREVVRVKEVEGIDLEAEFSGGGERGRL